MSSWFNCGQGKVLQSMRRIALEVVFYGVEDVSSGDED